MLSAEVIPAAEKQGHQIFAYDINQRLPQIQRLDVAVYEDVRQAVQEVSPDYVFHFAAETNVDRCEQDPMHAYKVNTLGTENVALVCQELGTRLLYTSTAGVFYGDKPSPYTEFDQPKPCNIYGESKWQGELIVQRLLSKYFIIRPGWMVGGWEIDKKFVYKIVQQIREGKKELRVVSDKRGSPTFTKDFAKNLMELVPTHRYGLYHMTNLGVASRYDIACKIVELMGVRGQVKVNPVDSSQYPLPAPRADSEAMQNLKLELIGLNHMPPWEESLAEYIRHNKDK